MKKNEAGTAPAEPGLAPKVPDTSVLVCCWAGIVIAAGCSVTFNIHHDATWLHNALAVVAGITPPALAAILAHVASAFGEWVPKVLVFVVCAGAMAVSSIGTTKTLEPGDTFFGGLGFSLVADSASLLCLWGLMAIYTARAARSRWLAGQDAGTAAGSGNQPGTGSAAAPTGTAAGSGNQPGTGSAAAPTGTAAGSGNQPGRAVTVPGAPVPAAPAPGSGPAARPETATAGQPGGPGETGQPASRPVSSPRPPAAPRKSANGGGEPPDAVVEEIAARPRPALETTGKREERALAILAEFKKRTGIRMTNQDLARALGVRKSAVVGANGIRKAIEDREAAA